MLSDLEADGSMSLKERIEHVRFTLADMCLEKNSDRFSFFRLLNRVIFLFQTPLIFAICRRSEGGGYLVDRYTHGDELYVEKFKSALSRLGLTSELMDVREDAIKPYAIRLFNSSFFVVPFRVIRDPKTNFTMQKVDFEPLSVDEPVGSVLRQVFRPFGKALNDLGIEDHIEENFQEIFRASALIRADQDDPRKYPADREVLKIMTRYERRPRRSRVSSLLQGDLRIIKVVDEEEGGQHEEVRPDFTSIDELLEAEIGLISASPAFLRFGGQVSNIILSRKKFDRSDVRFGAYFYGIECFLSQSQLKQFRFCCQQMGREKYISFPDQAVDQWFWKSIEDNDVNSLIKKLRVPLSKHARLFPEYTLMSGASIINIDPFSRGDIGWIHADASEDEREQELQRFVVLHYLLQMMAPGAVKPSLLSLPIRVSGATWMAATIVVDGAASEAGDYCDVVSSAEFQARFLIYHSMMRDFENRLRRKSKAAYIRSVYHIFSSQVELMRRRANRTRGGELIGRHDFSDDDYRQLRQKTSALARLYPYDLVLFYKEGSLREFPRLRADGLGRTCHVDFGIYDGNPFFDRLRLRQFLETDDVKRQLRNLVNAELGLSASVSARIK